MLEIRIYRDRINEDENISESIKQVEDLDRAIEQAEGIISDYTCAGFTGYAARIYDGNSLLARVVKNNMTYRYFSKEMKSKFVSIINRLLDEPNYEIVQGRYNPIATTKHLEKFDFSEQQLEALQNLLDYTKEITGANGVEKFIIHSADSVYGNVVWYKSKEVEGEIVATYGVY